MKFLHLDFWKKQKIEEVEAIHEDHFHGHVSIHLGLIGVKVEALIRPDDLENVTMQMLNFVRQVAEDLAARGEVQGNLVFDWDENRYSKMNLKSESGLPPELPLPRLP